MNVSLTPELEQFVQEKVSTGRYHSASEVVREALRLLEERDGLRQVRIQTLREQVTKGVEQARRGELTDGEAVFDHLDAELESAERAALDG